MAVPRPGQGIDATPGIFFSPTSTDRTRQRPCSESPTMGSSARLQDDWGESPCTPQRSMASTQGSPWRSKINWIDSPGASLRRTGNRLGTSSSAPLFPTTPDDKAFKASTHSSTWFSSSDSFSRSPSAQGSAHWTQLGATWRQRHLNDLGEPVRKNCDEGHEYAEGCIPNWSKTNMRKLKTLEHELTWNYYRMKRHYDHPERQVVGDPHISRFAVVESMRDGSKNRFQFWRDLRPPFHVTKIRRDTRVPGNDKKELDLDLYHVTYQCGLDYVGERLWNEKGDAGSFDNMIHGTAIMRIPEGWPQEPGSLITVISWGQPTLNWAPKQRFDEEGNPIDNGFPRFVDPDTWMPISDELGLRAKHPRFAACREATRKAHRVRPVEVSKKQSLLLSAHSSLPQLAAIAHKSQQVELSQQKADPSQDTKAKPQYSLGEKVLRRDRGKEFKEGIVTSIEPLQVTHSPTQYDRGYKWHEVKKLEAPGSPESTGTSALGAPSSPSKTPSSPSKKKRQHRIFTPAAGFVRYSG